MPPVVTKTEAACQHCGTLYPPKPNGDDGGFCCAGCQFVYGMINSEGLAQFYDLKAGNTLPPVKSLAFQKRDYQWFRDLADIAERQCAEDSGDSAQATVDLQGISCAACVWLIERVFRRHPGGLRIMVDAQLGQMRIWWEPGKFDAIAFAEELQHFGYAVGPETEGGQRSRSESRALLTRVGVVGGLAMNAMAFTLPRYLGMKDDFVLARLFELITLASATLALLVGGGYFFRRAWRALTVGALHMDLPISLGLIAAYLGSLAGWAWKIEELMYLDFVAIFAFLMLGGRWLQQAALEKNRAALLADSQRIRDIPRLSEEGEEEIIPITDLAIGDRFRLRPGETLPVTASLENEAAEFSFEWINGEPEPRPISAGNETPAGAVNVGRHPVELRAREVYANSLLSKLLAVTKNAAHSESSRDLGRVLRIYLALVLMAAVIGGIAWLASDAKWPQALQVFISVLVVSCPCALGVAMPLLDEIVIARLRKAGLFVQNSELWSKLRQVRQVVFDKTGTLTRESPRLMNPEVLTALDPTERAVLSSLVADSRHPAGRAIREGLAMIDTPAVENSAAPGPSEIQEIVASGVSWTDKTNNTEWSLGKAGWKSENDENAHTIFARDGKNLAAFQFEEALRHDAVDEVATLQRDGFKIAILSGDTPDRVQRIAGELGLAPDLALAEASPEQKAEWIMEHDPDQTLYIGDGANDSLAFDAAACQGTPAVGSGVLEQKSDFYFLGQGLHAIRRLFDLTAKRRRVLITILITAIVYNIAAVAIALAGWMNPLLAAVLMPISSVVTLAIAATARGNG